MSNNFSEREQDLNRSRTVPLRGGGRVKGRPLLKKLFFGTFFCILLPFKNKNYFTLDNLSKYGHFTLKFVGSYFYWVVTISSKNRAILVQNRGRKKMSKFVSGYFITSKKNPTAIKTEGGGCKFLLARPLRK